MGKISVINELMISCIQDVAHDELEEVDGLVEDIAEEIRDLNNLVII